MKRAHNILTITGSNSSTSINGQLVELAAKRLAHHDIQTPNLREAHIPVYGIDLERAGEIPEAILSLVEQVKASDGLIVSTAEHNGNLTAYLKNILDWLSRVDRKWLANTKVLLMSAAPGPGAAKKAFGLAQTSLPFCGGEIVSTFNLPRFHEHTQQDPEFEITDPELASQFKEAIRLFDEQLEPVTSPQA